MPRRRHSGWLLIVLGVLVLVSAMRAGGLFTSLEYDAADARARLLHREVASDIRHCRNRRSQPGGAAAVAMAAPTARRADPRARSRKPQPAFLRRRLQFLPDRRGRCRSRSGAEEWHGRPVVLPAFFQQATAADGELLRTQPLEPIRALQCARFGRSPAREDGAGSARAAALARRGHRAPFDRPRSMHLDRNSARIS